MGLIDKKKARTKPHKTREKSVWLWFPLLTLSLLVAWYLFGQPQISIDLISTENNVSKNNKPHPRATYVTMGLCVQSKSEGYSFGNDRLEKRYDLATVLATRLWKQQDPSLNVLVGLAYTKSKDSNKTEIQQELDRLSRVISRAGGIPWPIDLGNFDEYKNPSLVCVRGAQLARVFAYDYPDVEDNDMLVTSDADAFVVNVTQQLHQPLQERNAFGEEYTVWISSFYDTIKRNLPTTMMVFTAMKAKHWRELNNVRNSMDNHDYSTTLQSTIRLGDQALLDPSGAKRWTFDQAWVSSNLARLGWCVVPNPNARFYSRQRRFLNGVDPQHLAQQNHSLTCNYKRDFHKKVQCEHGQYYYQNSNTTATTTNDPSITTPEYNTNCVWVHFDSNVAVEQLEQVYTRIAQQYPGYMSPQELYGRDRDPAGVVAVGDTKRVS